MAKPPSYAAILREAEQARWNLDDATAGLVDLDFGRPFLPEALAHTREMDFLDAAERSLLSQLRAHAYLGLGTLGEKLALPFVMSQASRCLHGDVEQFLALMGFGQHAAKHMALFERFAFACERGFDAELKVVGPAQDILARFLTQGTLGLGLLVLHFACATQAHHLRAARDHSGMDGQFKQLLALHWREEAQNARIVELLLADLAKQAGQHEREHAVGQYLQMLGDLSAVFARQVALDLATFQQIARPLSEHGRQRWRAAQTRSYEEVFLHHGVSHPTIRRTLERLFGGPFPAHQAAVARFSGSPDH